MTDVHSNPGQRLRLARERLGLTQAHLAEQLRVTRSAVSAWESGLRRLEGPAIVALQAVYGINAQWLLSGHGPQGVDPALQASANLLHLPLVVGVAAWDSEGVIVLDRAPRAPWPLTEQAAHRVLLESGGGSVGHLLVLTEIPGAAPGLPGGATHLLNIAEKVRESPVADGVYLYRQNRSSRGRFVSILDQPKGWLARPLGEALEAPILVPNAGSLSHVILGRVCLTGWSWLAGVF